MIRFYFSVHDGCQTLEQPCVISEFHIQIFENVRIQISGSMGPLHVFDRRHIFHEVLFGCPF